MKRMITAWCQIRMCSCFNADARSGLEVEAGDETQATNDDRTSRENLPEEQPRKTRGNLRAVPITLDSGKLL